MPSSTEEHKPGSPKGIQSKMQQTRKVQRRSNRNTSKSRNPKKKTEKKRKEKKKREINSNFKAFPEISLRINQEYRTKK